jgi:hypothetical protein
MKNIAHQKLVRVDAGDPVPEQLAGMVSDMVIDWELIAQQYDQMVKYATALRLGTAEAEQVLRRFTRGGPKHPTYRAIEEVGRAVKSVFVAEYMASAELRREIHEGLQVVENWNSANADLFYGKAGTIGGTDRENQEVSMLALHLLQSALVLVNTILIQAVQVMSGLIGRRVGGEHREDDQSLHRGQDHLGLRQHGIGFLEQEGLPQLGDLVVAPGRRPDERIHLTGIEVSEPLACTAHGDGLPRDLAVDVGQARARSAVDGLYGGDESGVDRRFQVVAGVGQPGSPLLVGQLLPRREVGAVVGELLTGLGQGVSGPVIEPLADQLSQSTALRSLWRGMQGVRLGDRDPGSFRVGDGLIVWWLGECLVISDLTWSPTP